MRVACLCKLTSHPGDIATLADVPLDVATTLAADPKRPCGPPTWTRPRQCRCRWRGG